MIETRNKLSESVFVELLEGLTVAEKIGRAGWKLLLTALDQEQIERVRRQAEDTAVEKFGRGIFVRGLIEISSYCQNNCYYCGLRRSNRWASRYRLSIEDILECCREGERLRLKTFVFQGGEDEKQDDAWIVELIQAVRAEFPDQAITLSVGERTKEAYRAFRKAGADRYLLRHETRNARHYARLHPREMSGARRLECLRTLKELGFQTGAGMMIGTPEQTVDCLLDDIEFLEELLPEMIGMGPFIPAAHTPFSFRDAGSVDLTCRMIALMRLRFPDALIPATTALATLSEQGRERGILSGANVVMPNLSPLMVRKKYSIYDHKLCTGGESAHALCVWEEQLNQIGYHITYGRGDYQQK